jgi:hypothetical protein
MCERAINILSLIGQMATREQELPIGPDFWKKTDHPRTGFAFPSVPALELRYDGLSYAIKMAATNQLAGKPSVVNAIVNTLIGVPKALITVPWAAYKGTLRKQPEEFHILDNVSGVIRPGTMTL